MSGSPSKVKDTLLEHVSQDVKKLQALQSDMSNAVDMVTNSNRHVQSLCEHLDHILMHGLKEYAVGYWAFVQYFTRSEAIHTIQSLKNVQMDIGRGRCWLYITLNEQVMESYIRMFIENQEMTQNYYLRDSFIRDVERLDVLQTLVAGLEYISFDMTLDRDYLDYGPTEPSAQLGINRSSELTPDIKPTFISSVVPQTSRKLPETDSVSQSLILPSKLEASGAFITGIVGSVFGKKQSPPKDSSMVTTPPLTTPTVDILLFHDEPQDIDKQSQESADGTGLCSHSPRTPNPSSSVSIPSKSDEPTKDLSPFHSPHSSLIQRMSQAGSLDQGKSMEDSAVADKDPELEEEELVVHVSKGNSRQKKTKSKRKKKKHKTEGKRDSTAVSNKSEGIDEGLVSTRGVGIDEGLVSIPLGIDEGLVSTTRVGIDEGLVSNTSVGIDEGLVSNKSVGIDEGLVSNTSVGIDEGLVSTTSVGIDEGLVSNKSGGIDEGLVSTRCMEEVVRLEGVGNDEGELMDEAKYVGVVLPTNHDIPTRNASRSRSNAVSMVTDMLEESVGHSTGREQTRETDHEQDDSSALIELSPRLLVPPEETCLMVVSPDLPVNRELLTNAISETLSSDSKCPVRSMDESVDTDHTPYTDDHTYYSEEPDGTFEPTASAVPLKSKSNPSPAKSSEFSGHSDSDFEVLSTDEFKGEPVLLKTTRDAWIPSPVEPILYEGSPSRPLRITENEKLAADVRIDENTRLVFSLDVLFEDDEDTHRLMQVATPAGVGLQRNAYILITNKAVYILRKDGIEGIFSREKGIRYAQFDHIVIGLGWQSLILVYHPSHGSMGISQSLGGVITGEGTERCVLLTAREAVSRSIVESVCTCASRCDGFLRSIPLNRDDEIRIDAIEKELIKLGSHTSMDIVRYALVNWEQVSGEPPPSVSQATNGKESKSGYLIIKTSNMLGMPVWKQAFFRLKRGKLFQYAGEGDIVAKNIYTIRNCGGCTRTTSEGKPFAISILDKEGTSLVIAASNEEELTHWLQALCEAVIDKQNSPKHHRTCQNCALLLTQDKLHILLEDWTNDSVQLVSSCEVVDVNDISVDSTLPLYCTISYDHETTEGVWFICFSSEFELGQFECALAKTWKEEFQINLHFTEVLDPNIRQRAHKAVELMQNSKYRSDSVTRGRSEFTYSAAF